MSPFPAISSASPDTDVTTARSVPVSQDPVIAINSSVPVTTSAIPDLPTSIPASLVCSDSTYSLVAADIPLVECPPSPLDYPVLLLLFSFVATH